MALRKHNISLADLLACNNERSATTSLCESLGGTVIVMVLPIVYTTSERDKLQSEHCLVSL